MSAGTSEIDKAIARLPLYDIERQLFELMEYFDAEDLNSEERAAITAEIEKYAAAEVTKVDNIRGYLEHAQMLVDAHRQQAERQRRMAEHWDERIRYLKSVCIKALEAAGKTTVEGKTGSLSIQKNGGVQPMEIYDENKLPSKYTPMVITSPPDKEAIRKALAAGEEVPGARLLERGVHLKVR